VHRKQRWFVLPFQPARADIGGAVLPLPIANPLRICHGRHRLRIMISPQAWRRNGLSTSWPRALAEGRAW
jgi:hypothetical protein